jgi:hypothetical protein
VFGERGRRIVGCHEVQRVKIRPFCPIIADGLQYRPRSPSDNTDRHTKEEKPKKKNETMKAVDRPADEPDFARARAWETFKNGTKRDLPFPLRLLYPNETGLNGQSRFLSADLAYPT